MQGISYWKDTDPVAFQLWRKSQSDDIQLHYVLTYGPVPSTIRCKQEVFYHVFYHIAYNKTLRTTLLSPNYPQSTPKMRQCAAMWLANLAYPEWIHVPCETPFVFAQHVLCIEGSVFVNVSSTFSAEGNAVIFNPNCVNMHEHCFVFRWHSFKEAVPIHACSQKQKLYNIVEILNALQIVSYAISVILAPVKSSDLCTSMSYYKMGRYNIYQVTNGTTTSMTPGFVIQKGRGENLVFGGNIVKCDSSMFISIHFLNDSVPGCRISLPRTNFTNKRGGCPLFLSHQQEGKCVPYSDLVPKHLQKNRKQHQSTKISRRHTCSVPESIPCTLASSDCMYISDICTFTLNEDNFLLPCWGGEHLQNCTQFECNMMFKCPGYYCIPWDYICDGKQDCPGGYDENIYFQCNKQRICPYLFKCAQSQKCVHMHKVCNEHAECPYRDDEYSCSLHNVQCPTECRCLTFVIYCLAVPATVAYLKHSLPHNNIYVRQSSAVFVLHLLSMSCRAVLLDVAQNNLTNICTTLKIVLALLVNVSHNKIGGIQSGCFSNYLYLRHIDLQHNSINQIQSRSFSNLPRLMYINVAANMITFLSVSSLEKVTKLFLLDVRQNKHIQLNVHFLLKYPTVTLTCNYRICCIVQDNTHCNRKPLWPESCHDMLNGQAIKIFLYTISVSIALANGCSLFSQIRQKKGTKYGGAYKVIVAAINLTDMLCSLHLVLLWGADLWFGSEIVIREHMWTSHFVCFFIFKLRLLYYVLSPVGLSGLSVARLMVVTYPMKSKFKKKGFVVKLMLFIFIWFLTFVVVVTAMSRVFYVNLPLTLCSPLVDPSKTLLLVKINTWAVVVFQLLSAMFLCCVYVALFRKLHQKKKKIKQAASKQNSLNAILIQVISLSTSCVVCWIPACSVYLVTYFHSFYPIMMVIWTDAAVATLTALVNPIVFIGNAIRD